eukprot:332763-Chlamydomonas_euryale.AAC.11
MAQHCLGCRLGLGSRLGWRGTARAQKEKGKAAVKEPVLVQHAASATARDVNMLLQLQPTRSARCFSYRHKCQHAAPATAKKVGTPPQLPPQRWACSFSYSQRGQHNASATAKEANSRAGGPLWKHNA